MFLSQNLKGVVCQSLVKAADNRRKVAMTEILVMTDAIANLILADKIFQIPANLQTGRDLGMQLMDQALLEAIKNKQIDPDDAYHHATDKRQFQQYVSNPETLPKTALLAG
jgi:twitching motility protein PilT